MTIFPQSSTGPPNGLNIIRCCSLPTPPKPSRLVLKVVCKPFYDPLPLEFWVRLCDGYAQTISATFAIQQSPFLVVLCPVTYCHCCYYHYHYYKTNYYKTKLFTLFLKLWFWLNSGSCSRSTTTTTSSSSSSCWRTDSWRRPDSSGLDWNWRETYTSSCNVHHIPHKAQHCLSVCLLGV